MCSCYKLLDMYFVAVKYGSRKETRSCSYQHQELTENFNGRRKENQSVVATLQVNNAVSRNLEKKLHGGEFTRLPIMQNVKKMHQDKLKTGTKGASPKSKKGIISDAMIKTSKECELMNTMESMIGVEFLKR